SAGASLLAACGGDGGGGGGSDAPAVVTSCYPLDYLVSRIAGDRVERISLATPGADAHGVELSVTQVMEIQQAALVLQIPGFQTALDDAVDSSDGQNVLDVSSVVDMLPADGGEEHDHGASASDAGGEDHGGHDGHDHGPTDPHVWHDPLRMTDVADAITERLTDIL